MPAAAELDAAIAAGQLQLRICNRRGRLAPRSWPAPGWRRWTAQAGLGLGVMLSHVTPASGRRVAVGKRCRRWRVCHAVLPLEGDA
jgi:hypothetical protein